MRRKIRSQEVEELIKYYERFDKGSEWGSYLTTERWKSKGSKKYIEFKHNNGSIYKIGIKINKFIEVDGEKKDIRELKKLLIKIENESIHERTRDMVAIEKLHSIEAAFAIIQDVPYWDKTGYAITDDNMKEYLKKNEINPPYGNWDNVFFQKKIEVEKRKLTGCEKIDWKYQRRQDGY